jgi:hypothetical protein
VSQWRYFSNSFGKMLHPVLWVYSLVIVLSGLAPALVFLISNPLLRSTGQATTLQAMLSTLTPMLVVALVLGLIGAVFAIFGDAALIHLINKLEMRERITVGMGLDGGEKIFQLIVVRVILFLPNLLVLLLAFALLWGQLSSINLLARGNPLSGLFGGMCGLFAITFVVNLITSALLVGAERALVIEKMSLGKALGLSGQLLATQIGDFILIGLIFVGLSIVIGILFSCVGQPLLGLMFSTADRSAMLSGNLLTNPILLLTLAINMLVGMLATILGTSVWTLAYRDWRADRLPAPPRNDFDEAIA